MVEKIKDEEIKLVAGASLWREAWRRLKKNKFAVVCLVIIVVIFAMCTIYAIPHLSSLKKQKKFEVAIVAIEPGSPAEKAGLKINDIILKYDGQEIRGYRQFENLCVTLDKNIEELNAKIGRLKQKLANLKSASVVNPHRIKNLESLVAATEKQKNALIAKKKTAKITLLIKRPLPLQTASNKPKKTPGKSEKIKYITKTLLVPPGTLGVETNEPPVFFQDFKRQDPERKDEPPSADHWFGTDAVGRDMFARTLFGGFISFIIGVLATIVASVIGVIYGSISGYFGGRVDNIMMRIVDILYGLPFLMIIILIKVIADDLKGAKNGGEIIAGIILGAILLALLVVYLIFFIKTLARKGNAFFLLILLFLLISGIIAVPNLGSVFENLSDNILMFITTVLAGIFLLLFFCFAAKHWQASWFSRGIFKTLMGFALFALVVAILQSFVVFDTSNEWFSFFLTFVIIGMYAWLTMARIARGQILEVRSQDYITAARALGASPARIIFKHSIPNILGPVIIYATISIPAVILLEAFLSFLGLGISELYCSWGTLAKDGFNTLSPVSNEWWMIVFPGGMMAIALFALNFLGDGIRDALDPRMR